MTPAPSRPDPTRSVPWSWPSLAAGSVLSAVWALELSRWDDRALEVDKLAWLPRWAVVTELALAVAAVLLGWAAVVGARRPWIIVAASAWTAVVWSFLAFEFQSVTSTALLPSVCGAVAFVGLLQLYANLRAILADRWGRR